MDLQTAVIVAVVVATVGALLYHAYVSREKAAPVAQFAATVAHVAAVHAEVKALCGKLDTDIALKALGDKLNTHAEVVRLHTRLDRHDADKKADTAGKSSEEKKG